MKHVFLTRLSAFDLLKSPPDLATFLPSVASVFFVYFLFKQLPPHPYFFGSRCSYVWQGLLWTFVRSGVRRLSPHAVDSFFNSPPFPSSLTASYAPSPPFLSHAQPTLRCRAFISSFHWTTTRIPGLSKPGGLTRLLIFHLAPPVFCRRQPSGSPSF